MVDTSGSNTNSHVTYRQGFFNRMNNAKHAVGDAAHAVGNKISKFNPFTSRNVQTLEDAPEHNEFRDARKFNSIELQTLEDTGGNLQLKASDLQDSDFQSSDISRNNRHGIRDIDANPEKEIRDAASDVIKSFGFTKGHKKENGHFVGPVINRTVTQLHEVLSEKYEKLTKDDVEEIVQNTARDMELLEDIVTTDKDQRRANIDALARNILAGLEKKWGSDQNVVPTW